MQRLRNIAGRILGVLLCAALALAPVGAVTAAEMPAVASHEHAAMNDTTPCDMPCDGCADGKASLSCVAACIGLIAAIPAADALPLPANLAHRVVESANDALVGREREPDKPPPKPILA
jgi:hypothetical protein